MRILFDFDGTVADTSEGVLESVRYALVKLNKEIPPYEKLRGFIGPSLHAGFTLIAGLSDEDAEKAVGFYREFYKREGIYKATLYTGMRELLVRLKESGFTLAVASLKPQVQLETVIAYLRLDDLFTVAVGSLESKKDNDKREILLDALQGESGIMVGDSPFDIMAGNALSLTTVAVTYGFSDIESLRAQNPSFIAKNTDEILRIINNLTE